MAQAGSLFCHYRYNENQISIILLRLKLIALNTYKKRSSCVFPLELLFYYSLILISTYLNNTIGKNFDSITGFNCFEEFITERVNNRHL